MAPTLNLEQDCSTVRSPACDLDAPATDAPRDLPTILLCWGYHRSSWIEPFERLKDDFRFSYIFYRNREEEEQRLTADPVLYWQDYDNAHQILDAVRPKKILFMSLTSGYPIALNLAAQSRGIPTYILQHGMFGFYEDERASESRSTALRKTGRATNPSITGTKSSSLGFLIRSMGLRDLTALPWMSLFFLILRRCGYFAACKHVRFRQRLPTGYICFTERNGTIYRELDHAQPDQIHVIGIPEYDRFFRSPSSPHEPADEAPYYLLIDQPLAENSWGTPTVSREDMIRFYEKLIAYCKSQNARLKVKLHPESYSCGWLPEDDKVEWIREADVVSLIRGAKACFGMFSTLVLPASVLKPLCLFDVKPSSMVTDLSQRGMAAVLDFFKFAPSDIHFHQIEHTGPNFPRFVEDYFFSLDGGSADRLAEVLRQ
ncbi:MAG: hypothetical protein WD894_13595 [Pirellulales bacterium]